MMLFRVVFAVAFVATVTHADMIKTVHCKNSCNDYLRIAESEMTMCTAEQRRQLECGTVVTCEAPPAIPQLGHSNDSLCCYVITYKEKGDCLAHDLPAQPTPNMEPPRCLPDASERAWTWALIVVLVTIVILQFLYIAFCSPAGCCFNSDRQKVSWSDPESLLVASQPPPPSYTPASTSGGSQYTGLKQEPGETLVS